MLQKANLSEGKDDIATAVTQSMRRMGVAGLPRNYEIFYEVLTGSNRELCEAFAALGERPTQAALDGLSRKYFAQSSRQEFVENAHDQISARAGEIVALIGRERSSLEKFGLILDQTTDGLGSRQEISRELLQKIVGIMAAATQTTLDQARQISRAMAEKSAELEKVKAKLAQYKRLAETDPLTGIWNRRAFDRKLAEVYSDRRSVMFHALVLADIDGFKAFNDRHGHPVGDRILQMVAQMIDSTSGAAAFVARTGGEEFAIVLDGLSQDAAARVAEDVRNAIAAADFAIGPSSCTYGPITVSLGLCMASEAADADDLYAKADRALYASKVGGRNRLTRFSALSGGKLSKKWLLYREE
ncbi:GGDEF domain-containing protein [Chelativorans intermedius]|uniref:diguanylate cyclase n=1 Tax=Chelativorans intermedius TaxID=515947 RepID=A0ABV6D3A1_9HYPH|nr:GGDEF domain-containing protein [Chelativorans intermedius]MCT8998379.1 GGDEF domain-containing protein [Chelativorans intermedius]